MLDTRTQELIRIGERLFSARGTLNSYWQDICENFYPERADFATTRGDGDWWSGLMSSEPVLKRRELANLIQVWMRPESQDWLEIHVTDEESDKNIENRRWLEYMTDVQRRAMYHAPAQFSKATKLCDHDWVTLGMAVLEIEVRRDMPSLIYRNNHIRDVAWSDNMYGETDTIYRRWKPEARTLAQMFPGKIHSSVEKAAKDEPSKTIDCYRIVRPRDGYEDKRQRTPKADLISIYIDIENGTVLEETPRLWNPYVIPRWQTIPGSQYGWSPCTGPGLSDARSLQTMVRVLLEAGEKAIDPPLVASEEALRSDVNAFSGGITFIDSDYDERSGAALRELVQSRASIPVGLELVDRQVMVLNEGFFLDKLKLPEAETMTAYQFRKLMEEHIRQALPLLTPIEEEYNNKIAERTFDVLRVVKAFGPEENIPQGLGGQTIRYEFRSPIRDMADELKSQKLIETVEILGPVAQIDPAQLKRINWDEAVKDALQGRRLPAKWMHDDKAFAALKGQVERARQIAEGAAAIDQGAETMGKVAALAAPSPAQAQPSRKAAA